MPIASPFLVVNVLVTCFNFTFCPFPLCCFKASLPLFVLFVIFCLLCLFVIFMYSYFGNKTRRNLSYFVFMLIGFKTVKHCFRYVNIIKLVLVLDFSSGFRVLNTVLNTGMMKLHSRIINLYY